MKDKLAKLSKQNAPHWAPWYGTVVGGVTVKVCESLPKAARHCTSIEFERNLFCIEAHLFGQLLCPTDTCKQG